MKRKFPLVGFFQKEIRQTLRDFRMRMILFAAPVFQLTLFGVALSNEVRNVRLAAQYAPSDQASRDIYERAIASGWFIPAQVTGQDPFEWVRSGEADAVMISPPTTLLHDVEHALGQMQLLINSQNVLKAQAVERYIKAITQEVLSQPGKNLPIPIQFSVRPLYNPSLETSIYMVPGVMCMLVCIITILLTSMGLARERESGTLETLISAPVHPWEVVLGKTLPYVFLGMCQIPLILAVAVFLFSVPVRGPISLLMIASFFFVLTTVAIGILISTIAQNQQQAMLGGFLFLFPAILLSGLMFPIENMPLPMWIMAEVNPLTHFIGLLRNILLKGGNLEYFLIHSGVLALSAGVCVLVALKKFRTTIS